MDTFESHNAHVKESAQGMPLDELEMLLSEYKSYNENGLYDEMIEFISNEIKTRKI